MSFNINKSEFSSLNSLSQTSNIRGKRKGFDSQKEFEGINNSKRQKVSQEPKLEEKITDIATSSIPNQTTTALRGVIKSCT